MIFSSTQFWFQCICCMGHWLPIIIVYVLDVSIFQIHIYINWVILCRPPYCFVYPFMSVIMYVYHHDLKIYMSAGIYIVTHTSYVYFFLINCLMFQSTKPDWILNPNYMIYSKYSNPWFTHNPKTNFLSPNNTKTEIHRNNTFTAQNMQVYI